MTNIHLYQLITITNLFPLEVVRKCQNANCVNNGKTRFAAPGHKFPEMHYALKWQCVHIWRACDDITHQSTSINRKSPYWVKLACTVKNSYYIKNWELYCLSTFLDIIRIPWTQILNRMDRSIGPNLLKDYINAPSCRFARIKTKYCMTLRIGS